MKPMRTMPCGMKTADGPIFLPVAPAHLKIINKLLYPEHIFCTVYTQY